MKTILSDVKKFWWVIVIGLLIFFGGMYMVIGLGSPDGLDGTQG